MSRRAGSALAVGAMLPVLWGCGANNQPQAERACGKDVVADWSDGRIDRTYPAPCYLAALAALPEDVRAYSTAKDDISRALSTSGRES